MDDLGFFFNNKTLNHPYPTTLDFQPDFLFHMVWKSLDFQPDFLFHTVWKTLDFQPDFYIMTSSIGIDTGKMKLNFISYMGMEDTGFFDYYPWIFFSFYEYHP